MNTTSNPQATSHTSHHAQRCDEVARGLREAVPVMLGFIPFALLLGAQAVQKGFHVLEVPLMTAMNFGGGSEFAAIRLWSSPPHVALIVAMSFLVNSRHILMGGAMVPFLRHLSRRRALAVLFFMCDESWAMALTDAQRRHVKHISTPYFMGVSLGLYGTWVMFTGIGALLGPVFTDVERFGFDMAFTAVFLVLLRGMWRGAKASVPWMVSLVVSAGVYQWVPGAWYVAVGALSGLLTAALFAGS